MKCIEFLLFSSQNSMRLLQSTDGSKTIGSIFTVPVCKEITVHASLCLEVSYFKKTVH